MVLRSARSAISRANCHRADTCPPMPRAGYPPASSPRSRPSAGVSESSAGTAGAGSLAISRMNRCSSSLAAPRSRMVSPARSPWQRNPHAMSRVARTSGPTRACSAGRRWLPTTGDISRSAWVPSPRFTSMLTVTHCEPLKGAVMSRRIVFTRVMSSGFPVRRNVKRLYGCVRASMTALIEPSVVGPREAKSRSRDHGLDPSLRPEHRLDVLAEWGNGKVRYPVDSAAHPLDRRSDEHLRQHVTPEADGVSLGRREMAVLRLGKRVDGLILRDRHLAFLLDIWGRHGPIYPLCGFSQHSATIASSTS
jgi:hypothetical protein